MSLLNGLLGGGDAGGFVTVFARLRDRCVLAKQVEVLFEEEVPGLRGLLLCGSVSVSILPERGMGGGGGVRLKDLDWFCLFSWLDGGGSGIQSEVRCLQLTFFFLGV